MICDDCQLELPDSALRCPNCGADAPQKTKARAAITRDGDKEIIEGKWVVEKKLGQGGMGSVFLATDIDLGRQVAIKMMSIAYTDNKELVARFEREARMMARLDHPNLVPVYAVGRREQTPFIVMKFLEGQSLGDYLADRKRLEPREVLPLLKQLCAGLQFIHEKNVVHRDLKPANVFVSPAGHVTLLDLGVARDTENQMTRSGVIVGTPRYMSPEQILGKRVDKTADLYSLATMVFELLTGTPVFVGDTDYSLMRAHVDEAPPNITDLAELPDALNDVLQKGLAKSPAERFQTANEFLTAFEAAIAQTRLNAKPLATDAGRAPVRNRATPAPARSNPPGGKSNPPGGRQPTPSPRKPGTPAPAMRQSGPRPVADEDAERPTSTEVPGDATSPSLVVAPKSKLPLVVTLAGLVLVLIGGVAFLSSGGRETPPAEPAQPAEPAVENPVEKTPVAVADPVEKPPEKTPVADPPPEPARVPEKTPEKTPEKVADKPPEKTPEKTPDRPKTTPKVAATADVTFICKVGGVAKPGAFVDVDSVRQKGTTPFRVTLPAGEHQVRMLREDGGQATRKITVVGGEPLKVVVDMEK
ncbi:MAG: protein kinase [Myxococcaceae bacterium]